MNPLAWWVQPAIYLAAAAALLGAFVAFVSHERGVGAAAAKVKIDAAYAQGYALAASAVRTDEIRKRTATEKAHVEDINRAEERHAADLSARSRLERLLARSAAAGRAAEGSSTQAGPGADGAARVFRGVFEGCAVEYGRMGKERGELADQVIGLQGYLLANEIGGDSPAGERLRAGPSSLATQPATAPLRSTPTGAAPPQGGAP